LPRLTLREGNAPWRFVFCGTVPGVAPAGRYPAPYVHGARTFLPGDLSAVAGAAVRPTDAGAMGCETRAVKGRQGVQSGVGWVERSETHRGSSPAAGSMMGFAALYPSYAPAAARDQARGGIRRLCRPHLAPDRGRCARQRDRGACVGGRKAEGKAAFCPRNWGWFEAVDRRTF
jgi:hypothetical protein